MGAQGKLVQRIYLMNGMFASLIGAGIGLTAGYAICLLQIKFHFLKLSNGDDSSFVIDYYPVQLKLIDAVVTIVIILSVSLLAAYFPAKRAGESEMSFK
jgi:lipoprotein-releasing system permease protein